MAAGNNRKQSENVGSLSNNNLRKSMTTSGGQARKYTNRSSHHERVETNEDLNEEEALEEESPAVTFLS
jgi:hypothetical protein